MSQAANVLTSENAADFYAQRLGLADAPEAVADEPSEPVQDSEQSEPVAEKEAVTEERKPNPKLEKRFSELTKQREMARQEAERERLRASELETKLKALEQSSTPKAQTFEDKEPQPSQFTDAFEYAKALSEWSAENAVKQMKLQEAEVKAAEERAKVVEAWNKRQASAKADLPDYEEMIASSNVMVSDQVRDAIIESDVGPKILYHLAENPEIAEALSKKSVTAALREIGRLEARFDVKEPSKTVQKTRAPAPIQPLRASSSAADSGVGSDGEFHGTASQWREARRAGKIR